MGLECARQYGGMAVLLWDLERGEPLVLWGTGNLFHK